MTVSLTSKIVSTLGNPEALVPLAVKDSVTSASLTAFAYQNGGFNEGREKCIDEFGAMIIWLGGIPFFKTILDKTAYKAAKLDPEIDIRVLTNEAQKNTALKYATGETEKSLFKAITEQKTFKNLFYTKFGIATGLTALSYLALTKIRQNLTYERVKEKCIKEHKAKQFSQELIQKQSSLTFKSFNANNKNNQKQNNTNNVSFGLSGKGFESFIFNPAKNTMIIDGVIIGSRLKKSRLLPETVDIAVSEGFKLFFLYFGAQVIQGGLEKLMKKHFNKSINLDARILASKDLSDSFKNSETLSKDLATFKSLENDGDILEFIHKNPDHIVTKAAKLSDVIAVDKKTNAIDVRKFVNINNLKKVATDIEELSKTIHGSNNVQKDIDKFIKSTKNIKIASILASTAACCVALGYVMPKVVYAIREKLTGSREFHVEKALEEKLAMQMK